MLESTLVLCKPDAVQRRLVGQIISRIERKGLRIVAMKMLVIDRELAAQHYAEHVNKDFYPALEAFIMSGPSIAMIVEGVWAIDVMRRMAGRTDARFADPGTIRGDFSVSTRMNLIHTSDLSESAKREIKLFFETEIPKEDGTHNNLSPYYTSQEVRGEHVAIDDNIISAVLVHRPILAGTVVIDVFENEEISQRSDAVPLLRVGFNADGKPDVILLGRDVDATIKIDMALTTFYLMTGQVTVYLDGGSLPTGAVARANYEYNLDMAPSVHSGIIKYHDALRPWICSPGEEKQ